MHQAETADKEVTTAVKDTEFCVLDTSCGACTDIFRVVFNHQVTENQCLPCRVGWVSCLHSSSSSSGSMF